MTELETVEDVDREYLTLPVWLQIWIAFCYKDWDAYAAAWLGEEP